LLWQKYIGFCPIVYLVGDINKWMKASVESLVIKEARKLGAEIHFIPYTSEYKESTIAQMSRIFAASSERYPDTYFLTSDIDMLPLSREWFNSQVEGKCVDIKCPDCGPHNYPICYIGASSMIWREFMGLKSDTEASIEAQIEERLKADIEVGGDALTEWCYDEVLVSRRITAWSGYSDSFNITIRPGGPPVDRVDRSCWPETLGAIEKYVDCHSLRPGHTDENWNKIHKLLVLILEPEDMLLVEDYRQKFIESLGPPKKGV